MKALTRFGNGFDNLCLFIDIFFFGVISEVSDVDLFRTRLFFSDFRGVSGLNIRSCAMELLSICSGSAFSCTSAMEIELLLFGVSTVSSESV